VQRVFSASVEVEGQVVGRCGKGMLVFAGAHVSDGEAEAAKLADRVMGLRIFADEAGKMNLSMRDLLGRGHPERSTEPVAGCGVLAISNFTVFGDASKNRRPSFVEAAPFERGKELFDRFVEELRALGCPVETGVFGADMQVTAVNDGPVTLILEV
jgi:D-aminoacyl-tRNA deacylase